MKQANGQENNEVIKPELITRIPRDIEGCTGLFTFDTTAFKRKAYIIETDLRQTAYIKMNGKLIKLKLLNNKTLPGETYKSTYTGEGFTVILISKTVKQIDVEKSLDSGTLEIIKDKQKIKVKVHGISGC
jgi:hypothetical protein